MANSKLLYCVTLALVLVLTNTAIIETCQLDDATCQHLKDTKTSQSYLNISTYSRNITMKFLSIVNQSGNGIDQVNQKQREQKKPLIDAHAMAQQASRLIRQEVKQIIDQTQASMDDGYLSFLFASIAACTIAASTYAYMV